MVGDVTGPSPISCKWENLISLGPGLFKVSAINRDMVWVIGYCVTLNTTDGGKTWTVGHVPKGITLRDISPVNHEIAWIVGLSRQNPGLIMNTRDGGSHWEQQDAAIDCPLVGIKAIDDKQVWAVTTTGDVIRTDDGGEHWEIVNNSSKRQCAIESISFIDNRTAWATSPGPQFTKLDHEANTLSEVGNRFNPVPSLAQIEAFNQNGFWISGPKCEAYKTIDGGESWEKHFSYVDPGFMQLGHSSISALDPNVAWALLYLRSVVKILDRGKNWVEISRPVDIECGLKFGTSIMKTADGGTTWKEIARVPGKRNESIYAVDMETLWMAGGGELRKSTDGGKSWRGTLPGFLRTLTASDVDSENNLWVVGSSGTVLKRDAKTEDWEKLESPSREDLFSIVCDDAGSVWVTGDHGSIFKTSDNGRKWESFYLGTNRRISSLCAPDHDVLWAVGGMGSIFRTKDGGENWESRKCWINNDLRGVAAYNADVAFVVGTRGLILSTNDGGASWKALSFHEFPSICSISILPDGSIVAVGNRGMILRSTDQGYAWQRYTWEKKNEDARWESFKSISSAKGIVLACGKKTVVKTNDNGKTWEVVDIELPYGLSSICAIDENTALITGRSGAMIRIQLL